MPMIPHHTGKTSAARYLYLSRKAHLRKLDRNYILRIKNVKVRSGRRTFVSIVLPIAFLTRSSRRTDQVESHARNTQSQEEEKAAISILLIMPPTHHNLKTPWN